MVQMLFIIQFRDQIHRTRPELIAELESFIAEAASAVGGKVQTRRKALTALFNEDQIGFWLTMVIFLEKVHGALKRSSGDLYRYTLVLRRCTPETVSETLSDSYFAKTVLYTGIWCSKELSKFLDHYMYFDDPAPENEYRQLKEWRSFPVEGEAPAKSASEDHSEVAPVLRVRFACGESELICFADAYTPHLHAFIANAESMANTVNDLDVMHRLLFKNRLREEWSPYMLDQGERFFRLLLQAYIAALKVQNVSGKVIFEDMYAASETTVKIAEDAYFSLGNDDTKYLLTQYTPYDLSSQDRGESKLAKSRNLTLCNRIQNGILHGELPHDLLELAYNIILLGRYFPDYLIPELFTEQGLNREIFFRSLAMLGSFGMYSGAEGCFRDPAFALYVEKAILQSTGKIHSAVRSIILSWVKAGKLRHCFNLVKILFELGGQASGEIMLKSIRSDILNGTWQGIEKSLSNRTFSRFVGTENAPILKHIYLVLKVLVSGSKQEMQSVFHRLPSPFDTEGASPVNDAFGVQVMVNRAAFYVANRNTDAASEELRKVMHLNQQLGKSVVPVHRLFAIMNLSRNNIDDALEHISFALEQAESMEQGEEMILTCYFAAVVNLLYGNVSKAERLIIKAEESAFLFGQSRWVIRARFLKGRINFETGRYEKAFEIFSTIENELSNWGLPVITSIVKAWSYRSRNFMDRLPVSMDAGTSNAESFDRLLFEIEAAYFSGDFRQTTMLAEQLLTSEQPGAKLDLKELSPGDFLFTEQPDWRSGFSQCENIVFAEGTHGRRIAWMYHAMAQCALQPSIEQRTEILGSMQRFMREDLLPNLDPCDSFYFYAWHCMVRDSKIGKIDMDTVLSMAYKRLQRRASRIEDMKMRQDFLSLPRWNKTLCLAARQHNLI